MELTKSEAVERHHQLWSWIAEETLKKKRCVTKAEAFIYFGWPRVYASCWCCEYTKLHGRRSCDACPIDWSPSGVTHCYRLFNDWLSAVSYMDYRKAANAAKQIAELPAKE